MDGSSNTTLLPNAELGGQPSARENQFKAEKKTDEWQETTRSQSDTVQPYVVGVMLLFQPRIGG